MNRLGSAIDRSLKSPNNDAGTQTRASKSSCVSFNNRYYNETWKYNLAIYISCLLEFSLKENAHPKWQNAPDFEQL